MTNPKTREDFENSYIPEPNSGCWLWEAYSPNGRYGAMNWNRRRVLAHIISWQIHKGDVPEGKFLDHKCRNTFCVNPDHLEPVTHIVNVRRGKLASSLTCKHGHFYADGFEYYIRPREGTRYRRCLTCYKIRFPATAKI